MIYGRLIKRYKRFLADVELQDGEIVTAHCPNSGRMSGCATPGWQVALSQSDNPKRKLKYTLEYVNNGATWICVNAAGANAVALRAIEEGLIPELGGYESYRREVSYGASRLDIMGEGPRGRCYIEVKSCTLVDEEGYYSFPDAPTERGRKHIAELLKIIKGGERGVMLFIIQREDGSGFRPAWDIDPDYAAALVGAQEEGLEVLCYACRVSPEGVSLSSAETFSPR